MSELGKLQTNNVFQGMNNIKDSVFISFRLSILGLRNKIPSSLYLCVLGHGVNWQRSGYISDV